MTKRRTPMLLHSNKRNKPAQPGIQQRSRTPETGSRGEPVRYRDSIGVGGGHLGSTTCRQTQPLKSQKLRHPARLDVVLLTEFHHWFVSGHGLSGAVPCHSEARNNRLLALP